MTIQIGVILPTSTPDPSNPILGDVRASARRAEEFGLDSIWSTDHLIPSGPMIDGTVALAAAAGATERIGIGFNVMILALHNLVWAAKQIAGLQYVSGNRLTLGIGTGNPVHGDIGWRAAGVPFSERGRRTDEGLKVLAGLVSGRTTVLPRVLGEERGELGEPGEPGELGLEVTLAPGAPMPPIVVAGNGDTALRRAARFGQGWISMGLEPDELAARLDTLESLAGKANRPTPRASVILGGLGDDPGRAAGRVQAYESVGVERAILAPTGPDWERDYAFAAALRRHLTSTRP